jgi:hypothetical protein
MKLSEMGHPIFRRVRLAPAAFVPDVPAAFFAPLTGDPYGSAMWRTAIFAVDPDVPVAVPAVVAGDPDVAFVDRCGNDFDGARRRWADADDDLGVCVSGADGEEESAGCGEKLFLHSIVLLSAAVRED